MASLFRPTWPTRAIQELGGERHMIVRGPIPEAIPGRPVTPATAAADWPRYDVGDSVATRKAYGDALSCSATIPASWCWTPR